MLKEPVSYFCSDTIYGASMDIGVRRLKVILALMAGICFLPCISAHAQDSAIIPVGEFSRQQMDQWIPKKFVNETVYSSARVNGKTALKAVSKNSASGLIKKIKINVEKYPFLNWQWRIDNRLSGNYDEKQKSGDDYAARIYVVVSGGMAIWNTRVVNYVWAKNVPKGEVWPSAFAGKNDVMIALRSAEAPVAVWQTEKRNIQEDFKKVFGKKIQFIDMIVLMSDTDNTRQTVTAYYGDIYFSAR